MKKFLFILFITIFPLYFCSYSLFAQEETAAKSSLSSSFSQAKFVPDISFILDFSTVYRDMKDEEFKTLEIPGFAGAPLGANRGFNFNYGELALYSAIDPYFELFAIFHLSTEGFGIEEGFVNTTSLPAGLQIKLGKFKSGFGRLNSQHEHYWDFSDQPVVYKTFLGDDSLDEKGIQATWTAPTAFYLLIGAESLQGENEESFGYEGFSNNQIEVNNSKRPDLYTGFLKSSFDIGNTVILYGVSGARGKARINNDLKDDSGHALYGDSYILCGDLTVKYLIDSYRYASLQGEYLYRDIMGDLYEASASGTTVSDIRKKQSGLYAQFIIKPFLLWRIGLRYETLLQNEIEINKSTSDAPDNLQKYSAMIEYDPSEFSRIRLQYNYDKTKYCNNKSEPVNEVILQFTMSIGAHGAHSF